MIAVQAKSRLHGVPVYRASQGRLRKVAARSSSQEPFGLIVNPHAGKQAGPKPWLPHLRDFTEANGVLIEEDGLERQRARISEQWSDRARPSFLAILGGDGTIHQGLNDWITGFGVEGIPPVLILGGGTQNVLATDLSIRGDPYQRLIAAHRMMNQETSRALERNMLRIDTSPHEQRFYGFIFANGALYSLIDAYQGIAEKHGRSAFFRVLTRAFFSASFREKYTHQHQMEFNFPDGTKRPGLFFATLVASVGKFMFGVRPFDANEFQAGELGFLATDYNVGQLLRLRGFPLLWRGLRRWFPLAGKHYHNDVLRGELQIYSRSGISIDGDLYPPNGYDRVKITPGPRLHFLEPPDLG